MSSSVHVDNKKKDILIIGKAPTQGLDGTTLTVEKKYSINFSVSKKKVLFKLAVIYSFGTEIIKFKAKDSQIVATPLCLGDISKDFSADNMKKTGLNRYGYDFSVDYDAIAVDDTLDIRIHKYLMKKHGIVQIQCLDL